MPPHPLAQQVMLSYLWQRRLGESQIVRKRNVLLGHRTRDFKASDLESRFGNFPYKNAHCLEGRDPSSVSGIWGISHWRCERLYGNLPVSMCPDDTPFHQISTDLHKIARAFRKLCYYRVTSPDQAINLLGKGREVIRFAFEVNSDWYDPVGGVIPVLSESAKFVSSHAIPISEYDGSSGYFGFHNSWGRQWGDDGRGRFPKENWDKSIVSAWDTVGEGLFIPSEFDSGIIIRGWKWGVDLSSGMHGIDIYDSERDEYLAWAFCVVREGKLDIDEFFVNPKERGKGYARELSRHVKALSATLGKPIRLIVSFADTEDYAIDGAFAVAKLFQLKLVEADVRWASMFGLSDAPTRPKRDWKPCRPESILEKLRPRSEPPIEEPCQYTIFFGTNRKPVDSNDISKGFLNERGYDLYRGSCLVEIPSAHKFGSVGRRWYSFLDPSSSNLFRVVGVQSHTIADLKLFATNYMNRFDESSGRHNLLFIHGFKNSFNEAACVAAQIGVDLKINGSTFLYSWPSAASIHRYPADEAAIESSVSYCQKFVFEILEAFPDIPLHILAHSMGNRLAVSLFEKLASSSAVPGKLGQLIFAAADIDVDRFNDALPQIRNLPKRLTSYVSRGDLPLFLSQVIHDFPRIGLAPPVFRAEGIDTILVEGFRVFELLGHGYHAQASSILTDMFYLIRYNSLPGDRARIKREEDETSPIPFWSLPVGGD